jgi:hypothetical protein
MAYNAHLATLECDHVHEVLRGARAEAESAEEEGENRADDDDDDDGTARTLLRTDVAPGGWRDAGVDGDGDRI